MPTTLLPDVGVYRHYKDGIYYVNSISTHTETGEALVNYCDSEGVWWSRPLEMWFEEVEYEGGTRIRFERIKKPERKSS